MTVRHRRRAVVLILWLASVPACAAVLTGKVRSTGAQILFTPPSMSSPVVLRTYVGDGTQVKKGDPVLSIDAGQAASQLRSLRDKIEQTKDTTAKDIADLKVKAIDARLAWIDAKAARDTAAVDAAIPRKLVSGLDYDTYQGTYQSALRDAALKASDLKAAQAAVQRKKKDGLLQVKKLETQLTFYQSQVDTATVRAHRDGVVIHAFQGNNPWGDAGRYKQGSTSFPGTRVGQVVASGDYSVRAWALQPDRRGLKVGQQVHLHFDALPEVSIDGHIRAISGASSAKSEWGSGRYYSVDITLGKHAHGLPLLPGMSVRVETGSRAVVVKPAVHEAKRAIKASGEVYAQDSVAISPPQIPGLWQMNVTRMATDGASVKKGQMLVVFAGGNLAQQMPARMSALAEKKRAQEQLRLKLADDARKAMLATAQAHADAKKARRKARQPKQYIAGIKYKKLVIDRRRTRQRLALAEPREHAEAQSRMAQQKLANAQVAELQRDVKQARTSLASLTVRAPRAGLFLHKVQPDGSKVDTGAQVWRGMSVGSMPDMHSLAVHAGLPERDIERVHVGQPVRVQLSGGAGGTFEGRVASIGDSVHSKSSVEPLPVVDLRIMLDGKTAGLKPGQPVRVEILPPKDKA